VMRNKDGVSVKYIRRKTATEGDMPRGLEILLTSKKLCGAVFLFLNLILRFGACTKSLRRNTKLDVQRLQEDSIYKDPLF
jgi:hypothetical protein